MKINPISCAIYTRKSSEEGLEQDFNSLDAQREACGAYILSQKSAGWVGCKDTYDDGGFSGGSTERPALQRLLTDIALGKIKVIVVYKVDRLTRSLADFAKMVELFDTHNVSFVSVTQQFNTTTSMGRLTLNVLLSFAQFEREVTGERIRDKIAASKRKGMWMGGMPPIGYRPHERTLIIDSFQAERVREIFKLYLTHNCVRTLAKELQNRGWRTPARITQREDAKGDCPFSRGHLYRILRNPIYIGQIPHKDQVYAGNHPPIIENALWQAVQERLELNRQGHKLSITTQSRYVMTGLLWDGNGNRYTGSHSKKSGTRSYRYYVQQIDLNTNENRAVRIPAQELEDAIIQAITNYLSDIPNLLAEISDHTNHTSLLHRIKLFRTKIEEGHQETIRSLITKIIIEDEVLNIELNLQQLCNAQEIPIPSKTLRVPIKLQRSGLAMRLIVPSTTTAAGKPDPKLIRLITRSHDWAMRFISGRHKTIREIAQAEEVTASYVTRLIQIGFMAPDLMQIIVRGQQPPHLTAHALLTAGGLPLSWEEQALKLGFTYKSTASKLKD